jgi:hypothetical protein
MNTDKKNQHYIPKFYLRNFSYQNNKKQIGIYNIENEVYIQTAKLKTQGSKNFFYGMDGQIEDNLSNIEGTLATIIKDIIETKKAPIKESFQYTMLLLFVTLTDLRNPVRINGMKDSFDEMKRIMLSEHPNTDTDSLLPNLSHEELVRLHISQAVEISEMISDLDYKLLINKTTNSFISSNFPVVKYNQFLEGKRWPHSKSGYGLTGLQILIPINDELALMFYDKNIYKLGDNRKQFHYITNTANIDDINKLQFLNCLDTIYFNDKVNLAYIKKLHNESKKHKRANVTRGQLGFLIKEGDEENRRTIEAGFKNFLQINKTDCEINLKIDGLKIHSKGKKHKLNDSLAQIRPHVDRLR